MSALVHTALKASEVIHPSGLAALAVVDQAVLDAIPAALYVIDRDGLLVRFNGHRFKNTLAPVQSIALQTFRSSPKPEDFLDKFQGRLLALSKAHDLLARQSWVSLAIGDLLDAQLDPYAVAGQQRIHRDGAAGVALSPRVALALGMVLHELATNALKYGALSSPAGRVELSWQLVGACSPQRLRFRWSESLGPPVREPTRQGFGTRFIERSVVRELGGDIQMSFDRSGLQCAFEFPNG